MFGIRIGRFGESTFPEVWLRRYTLRPGGHIARQQLLWVPAWWWYDDLKLSCSLAPFSLRRSE